MYQQKKGQLYKYYTEKLFGRHGKVGYNKLEDILLPEPYVIHMGRVRLRQFYIFII